MSVLKYYDKEKKNWEPVNSSDRVIGGGGAQVQSDWNQNDETAPDYIKNRICYKDTLEYTLPDFNDSTIFRSSHNSPNRTPVRIRIPLFFDMFTEKTVILVQWGTAEKTKFVTDDGVKFKIASGPNILCNPNPCISKVKEFVADFVTPSNAVRDQEIYDDFHFPIGSPVSFTIVSGAITKIDAKFLPDLVGKTNDVHGEIFNDYLNNVASNTYSHAEGSYTTASGDASHAEGSWATASGDYSHAEGYGTTASVFGSHAEGYGTTASGDTSHAEGEHTTASSRYQHVQGEYNIDDAAGKYAHIVGNGKYNANSNAHTLDWSGNSWYQGSVLVAGTNMDAPDAELNSNSVVIKSSTPGSTKRFRITVDDTGAIKATEIV